MPIFDIGANVLANSVTPAVTDTALTTVAPAVAETATQSIAPTMFEQLGMNAMGEALPAVGAQPLGNLGQIAGGVADAGGVGTFDMLGAYAGQGADMLGDAGNFLVGDQGQNAMKIASQGYNMYGQNQAMQNAKRIQDEQLRQSQDAFNRDKTAEEKRSKLNF